MGYINNKGVTDLALMMIIILVICLILILFYLLVLAPGTIVSIIPKMPEIPAV